MITALTMDSKIKGLLFMQQRYNVGVPSTDRTMKKENPCIFFAV